MNPRPSGHTIGSAHIGTPALADDELAQRARHRYQCAECGRAIYADTPAGLRQAALAHHGIVRPLPAYRHIGEIPAAGSRQDGTR